MANSETTMPSISHKTHYVKSGTAGVEGTEYQINLLMIFLLKGLRRAEEWYLSTENDDAEKLDDLVFESAEGNIFLQAKHKQNKKNITSADLLSINPKHNDFSLPKYFFSYIKIKKKFAEIKHVIICTNIDLKVDAQFQTHTQINEKTLDDKDMLYYKETKSSAITKKTKKKKITKSIVYTFKSIYSISESPLKQSIENYYKKNLKAEKEKETSENESKVESGTLKKLQEEGLEEKDISDENIKEFLEHLQFLVNYPSEGNLKETVIMKLISETEYTNKLDEKTVYNFIYDKVKDWFKQIGKAIYLTKAHARAFFYEIRRNEYCNELKKYDIYFRDNDLPVKDPNKKIWHIVPQENYIVNVLKMYRTLQKRNENEFLLIAPQYNDDAIELVIDAFGVISKYTHLIVVCPKNSDDSITEQICVKIKGILDSSKYKKLILVSEDDNRLTEYFEETSLYEVVEEEIKFCHVTGETRENIVNRRNIVFQGDETSLTELLALSDEKVMNDLVDTELVKFVTNENIQVGSKVEALPEDIKNYYIHRTFNLNENTITEEEICEITNGEKIILISDAPGMGKTTVVTHLASVMKKNNPNLWVIKININNYTKVLLQCSENGQKSITIPQLLDSQEETRPQSTFEKKLFSLPQRVLLIIDGVDEVMSPEYKEIVLNLIMDCKREPNYIKIYLTTRPHIGEELETKLKVKALRLSPFSEQNQTDFLNEYWKKHLGLKKLVEKKKCLLYAQKLIREMHDWIKDDNKTLPEIPLQTRMLAEVFQERRILDVDDLGDWQGCNEFVTSNECEVPKFPLKINLVTLYQLFLSKKRDIFMKDKSMLTGNVFATNAVKKECKECERYHQLLALELIFEPNYVELLNYYKYIREQNLEENNVVALGIVQKINSQYYFVHRTFAEFYVAQCLVLELKFEYHNKEFLNFFTDYILMRLGYESIRSFLDGFLQNESLPDEVFQAFSSLEYNSKLYNGDDTLFHTLSKEGCIYLLEFFFKCLPEELLEINTIRDAFGKSLLHNAASGGHLDIVELLLEKGADINTEDNYGERPLHDAVSKSSRSSRLHTSKLLLERGANVDLQGHNKRTALHAAVKTGDIKLLELLLEEGADIRIVDRDGLTVLHHACGVFSTRCDIIQALVTKGADIHSKSYYGSTPLHEACHYPKLDVVKFLVQNGANVNEQNKYGATPLHINTKNSLVNLSLLERMQLDYRHYVDICKHLVDNGADTSIADNEGRSVLHSAALAGNIPILSYLLEICDVNLRDSDGNTALHVAAREAHLGVTIFLLENGANIDIRNKDGCSALHEAARYGRRDVVQYLIEVGAQVDALDYYGRTALHSSNLYLDVAEFLIRKGLDINVKDAIFGRTVLHCATLHSSIDLYYHTLAPCKTMDRVKFLVGAGANVNIEDEFGSTPLHYTIENECIETAKYLIANGATVGSSDKDGCTLIHKAAKRENWLMLKFLIEKNLWLNAKDSRGRTVLHDVCSSRNKPLDLVEALAEAGADVNAEDNQGRTPFHDSIATSPLELIDFFIRRGANVNARDAKGFTPLLTAMSYSHEDSSDKVKLLLQNGADINVRYYAGNTILTLAVELEYLDMVKILVENKVDVNLADAKGWTALHISSRWNYLDKVRYLLENKANLDIEDNDGCTALHVAARPHCLEVVQCLIANGANVNAINKEGQTPLQVALERDCLCESEYESLFDVMRFLVENGGN